MHAGVLCGSLLHGMVISYCLDNNPREQFFSFGWSLGFSGQGLVSKLDDL